MSTHVDYYGNIIDDRTGSAIGSVPYAESDFGKASIAAAQASEAAAAAARAATAAYDANPTPANEAKLGAAIVAGTEAYKNFAVATSAPAPATGTTTRKLTTDDTINLLDKVQAPGPSSPAPRSSAPTAKRKIKPIVVGGSIVAGAALLTLL